MKFSPFQRFKPKGNIIEGSLVEEQQDDDKITQAMPSRPKTWISLLELIRPVQEMSMLLPSHRWLKSLPKGDGHPVVVLPGFGADNKTTLILRHYLKQWGYAVEPWEMDQNITPMDIQDFDDVLVFRDKVVESVGDHIAKLHKESGKKVTLIGWSLGGIFSRLVASNHQDHVKHVITLGTPFGDPRTVPVYTLMEKLRNRGMTQQQLDEWIAMCNAPIGDVALSMLFSRTDGFVSTDIAYNIEGDKQEALHVFSSHVGFAVNPLVIYLVAKRLGEKQDQWQRFQPSNPFENKLFEICS